MSPKITLALWQVMNSCGYVQKTGTNKFHNYRYAGEADLLDKLRPAMLEAGLLLLPSVEEVSPIDAHGIVTVKVAYTLAHKDGEVWPDKLYAAGSGGGLNSKGGVDDKGVYKAITGANKYLLFKLFQIETGDDPESDGEAAQRPPQRQERAPQPAVNWQPPEANAPTVSNTEAEVRMFNAIHAQPVEADLDKLIGQTKWLDTFDTLDAEAKKRVRTAIANRRMSLTGGAAA